jgi:hypothetical protein
LETPFFAQLLQRAKEKRRHTGSGGAEDINEITKIAKDVQKKVAGSGWGAGAKSMRIRVRTFFTAVGGKKVTPPADPWQRPAQHVPFHHLARDVTAG